MNRIMIAGTNSGCGKTTITCALLKALCDMGFGVSSFKCGPDYIDPMFHKEVIGIHSRNIDSYMLGEEKIKYLFAKNSKDISIIEGVMGFYDGKGGGTTGSSWEVSQITDTPVILAVNCKGAMLSIAAVIKGFKDLYKNKIVGVILNNVSEHMYPLYKKIIEENVKIVVLGFLPYCKQAELKSRHLGLVTANEVKELKNKMELLAQLVVKHININKIIEIAKRASIFTYQQQNIQKKFDVKIAVAQDNAFCFYYEDSLNLLEEMGAELIYFSPLKDAVLPKDISGIIFGGGYPELYAKKLSDNKSIMESIKNASDMGIPIFAECGGFMYLGKSIKYKNLKYNMVGVINTHSTMMDKLQNFGYATLSANTDNILMKKGQQTEVHEFHYFTSDNMGEDFSLSKGEKKWEEGFAKKNIFAGYSHLHFWQDISLAENFLESCTKYKGKIN